MEQATGVDAAGCILTVGNTSIQSVFQSAIDDVCQTIVLHAGDLVDSIYLYGSVARGQARVGESDLDVTLVLSRKGTIHEMHTLEAARILLERRHPVFTKIDIDVGDLGQVMAPENAARWGFWLKHHCRCIYGADLSVRFPLFRPSKRIALAVNGDFPEVLADYAARIDSQSDVLIRRRLQREASRKLIRATNVLRADDGVSWPMSLDDHVAQCVRRFPEKTFALQYFCSYADEKNMAPDSTLFTVSLRMFSEWMQATIEAST